MVPYYGVQVKHFRNLLIYKGFPRAFGGFSGTVWTVWDLGDSSGETLPSQGDPKKFLDIPLDN